MIQVFDTAAVGIALARRKLGCPDCGPPPIDYPVVSTRGGGRLVSGSRASVRSWRLRERPR
jgi:hypothetical protein